MDAPDDDAPSWMREDPAPAAEPPGKGAGKNKDKDKEKGDGLQGWAVEGADEESPGRGGETGDASAPSAAADRTWGEYFRESFRRDGRLILISLVILVCMNLPFVRWALYPFDIFSTWIHELCHGLAAVLAGGRIEKLEVFPDATGLAYTTVPSQRRGFVVSAGYQGTAVVGCLLLLFRRTKRGPRAGTMAVAVAMVLSCLLWVRNAFGFVLLFFMGLMLAGVAAKVPSKHMRNVYVYLAVTCSLNAIAHVRNLFGTGQEVNGEPSATDAQAMAEIRGGTAGAWAFLWLILALLLTAAGILFAVPGPDEVADFKCCGVCQDLGVFRCCNYPGQGLAGRVRERWNERRGVT